MLVIQIKAMRKRKLYIVKSVVLCGLTTERLKLLRKGMLFLIFESNIIGYPEKSHDDYVSMPKSAGKSHVKMEIEKKLQGFDNYIKPGILFLLNDTEILAYDDNILLSSEAYIPLWLIKSIIWTNISMLCSDIHDILMNREFGYCPVKTTMKIV